MSLPPHLSTPIHLFLVSEIIGIAMTLDEAQRAVIVQHAERLLNARDYPKTICPSEVARAFSAAELRTLGASEWRGAMDAVRQVVWDRRELGDVEVLQKGEVVDVQSLEDVRGPIRVRKVHETR
jgi:hypothetical protein